MKPQTLAAGLLVYCAVATALALLSSGDVQVWLVIVTSGLLALALGSAWRLHHGFLLAGAALGALLAGAWFLSWVIWVVACPSCSDGGELQRRVYITVAPAGAGLILGLWLAAMTLGAGATWLIRSLFQRPVTAEASR